MTLRSVSAYERTVVKCIVALTSGTLRRQLTYRQMGQGDLMADAATVSLQLLPSAPHRIALVRSNFRV